MNILKLNINKNSLRIKKGQIVSPIHYEDGAEKLVDNDGKIIPVALYTVSSVGFKNGKHSMVLQPISYDLAEERWAPGAPDYTIDMDDNGLEHHLGISKSARKGGIFTEYLRDLFRKYGKGKPFDDTVDYDGVLRGSVHSLFEKSPVHIDYDDRDAIMIDAIMQSANKETVQRFNPNDPHPFLMMVLALFKKKVMTGINKFVKIHLREVPNQNEEMTDDEYFDNRTQHDVGPHNKGPHRELVEKELIEGVRKYLQNTPEKNIMLAMFDMFQQGYQNNEVIKHLNEKFDLNMKPVNFTKTYMPKFKDYIWEYAFKTKNNLLMDLMNIQMNKPRLSSEEFEAGSNNFLQDVLKEYKKVTGELEEDEEYTGRTPVGEITRVKKSEIHNVMDEDYVANMVLSDKISVEDFQSEMDQFMSFMGLQDEIIEEDNKIVGLKIMNETRNPEELKKESTKAISFPDKIQPDFFGYKVEPGKGQKHPNWGEVYYILISKTGLKFGLVRPHGGPKEHMQIIDLRNGNFVRINGRSYVKVDDKGMLHQAYTSEVQQMNNTLDKLGYKEGTDYKLDIKRSDNVFVIKMIGTKDYISALHQIEKVFGYNYDVTSEPSKKEIYLEFKE